MYGCFCFFKQKTAYERRISDWSSDVCSSDLYIPKAYSPEIMLSAVRLVMSGGVYVPPMLLAAAPGAVANNGHRNLDSLDALRELLTERQIEVLRLLSQGKPNKSIARDLNISEGTVKIHLAAIFRALDVRNRVEAVVASRKLAEL